MEIPENLIEEIRELIYGEVGPLWKRPAQGEVKKAIRLILSAICDGELKWPGEQWRAYVSKRYISKPDEVGVIDGSLHNDPERWIDGLYIQLNPEEGMALDALLQEDRRQD